MKTAVLLLNFGEPEHATREEVTPYLERIFLANASLMGRGATPEAVRERSRRLAEERAPGLIEDYERIGGSPLAAQARAQAAALQAELGRRGVDVVVLEGMQFTTPTIADAVRAARAAGAERLVAIPVYPLCGPSTTAAALVALDEALVEQDWGVEVRRISGWHPHPAYVRLRADAVRRTLEANGLTLDARTRLVFSAHGTPLKYVEEGSRYVEYVLEFCAWVARELGGVDYVIGYQNHGNRPEVRWTQPDTEAVVREIDADRIVVDAVSFMHEQSETLAELDVAMRGVAEARGLGYFRVPVPHDAPEFPALLADLVVPELLPGLAPCRCVPDRGVLCLNAARG
jgi:protoporphyrin/coproporphyrin ferrochelatase